MRRDDYLIDAARLVIGRTLGLRGHVDFASLVTHDERPGAVPSAADVSVSPDEADGDVGNQSFSMHMRDGFRRGGSLHGGRKDADSLAEEIVRPSDEAEGPLPARRRRPPAPHHDAELAAADSRLTASTGRVSPQPPPGGR